MSITNKQLKIMNKILKIVKDFSTNGRVSIKYIDVKRQAIMINEYNNDYYISYRRNVIKLSNF